MRQTELARWVAIAWLFSMTTLPASGKTNGEYFHLEEWDDYAGLAKSPFRTDGKPDYFSFYGGDIAGLRQNLDYLEDLGITIIYFNPLFQARSNHKYEATEVTRARKKRMWGQG